MVSCIQPWTGNNFYTEFIIVYYPIKGPWWEIKSWDFHCLEYLIAFIIYWLFLSLRDDFSNSYLVIVSLRLSILVIKIMHLRNKSFPPLKQPVIIYFVPFQKLSSSHSHSVAYMYIYEEIDTHICTHARARKYTSFIFFSYTYGNISTAWYHAFSILT